jgi:hypothetical protein
MRLNVPRAVALYLAWVGLTCGVLVAAIQGVLPFRLGAVGPDAVFLALVEAEIFFVTVVWPFFMPRLILPKAGVEAVRTAGPGAEPHLMILQVGVLLVVALPLALVSQNLSEISVGQFFQGHLQVAALACFVTVLLAVLGEARVRPWYFLGFFTVSALFPFLEFLSAETGGSPRLGFLAAVSPFWGAAQLQSGAPLGWAPGVQAAIFGVLAVGLLAAAPFLRPVDAPASTN